RDAVLAELPVAFDGGLADEPHARREHLADACGEAHVHRRVHRIEGRQVALGIAGAERTVELPHEPGDGLARRRALREQTRGHEQQAAGEADAGLDDAGPHSPLPPPATSISSASGGSSRRCPWAVSSARAKALLS